MIVVAVSGGFDPLHVGHLEMFEEARKLGDHLLVIVNRDDFLIRKKGYALMPLDDRRRIIRELRMVHEVIASVDEDDTVCKTLRMLCTIPSARPSIFANGGDRASHDSPERAVCEELGIRMVDGLGDKIRSSSTLVKSVKGRQPTQGDREQDVDPGN